VGGGRLFRFLIRDAASFGDMVIVRFLSGLGCNVWDEVFRS
jgi:hypothetical protein